MLILYAVQALTPVRSGRRDDRHRALHVHNVLYAVGSYPAGVLADRYGKGRFLLAAYTLAILIDLILVIAAPSSRRSSSSSSSPGPLTRFSSRLNGRSLRTMAPIEVSSTGFGALASANGVGDLVSSVIVGTLWTTVSPVADFVTRRHERRRRDRHGRRASRRP